MKKIGKKKSKGWHSSMISTFRAFATSVSELKIKLVPKKGTLPDFYLITQKCFMTWEAAIKNKVFHNCITSIEEVDY